MKKQIKLKTLMIDGIKLAKYLGVDKVILLDTVATIKENKKQLKIKK